MNMSRSRLCVWVFMSALLCDADGMRSVRHQIGTLARAHVMCADLAFTFFQANTNGMSFTLEWSAGVTLSGDALDVFHAYQLSPPCWSNRIRYAGIPVGTNSLSGFIPHDGISRSAFFRAADIADSDGDGLTDAEEKWVWHTDANEWDSDGDGMPDGWEIANGLSPLDLWDSLLDPDGDGLINLHEYYSGTNPGYADATTNTSALANATFAIDSRIAGKNPSDALRIFSTQNHANTNYVRNPSCWVADIDLTCCSPWNSFSGALRAGTLISPRHVLFAAHYDEVPVGAVMRFVDMQNGVVDRVLVAKIRHLNYVPWYPDLTVGLLHEEVPPEISFAKILPDNYQDWLGTGARLPALRLDQEEKALIGDVWRLSAIEEAEGVTGRYTIFDEPLDATRTGFYEGLVIGDSGNPAFLVINGQPVLLTVWTFGGPGAGTSLADFRQDVNALMSQLEAGRGSVDGYQLEAADLSGFVPLRQGDGRRERRPSIMESYPSK